MGDAQSLRPKAISDTGPRCESAKIPTVGISCREANFYCT